MRPVGRLSDLITVESGHVPRQPRQGGHNEETKRTNPPESKLIGLAGKGAPSPLISYKRGVLGLLTTDSGHWGAQSRDQQAADCSQVTNGRTGDLK